MSHSLLKNFKACEIAAASQEQAQGIDQVNTAVAQMDKVTQQNAANAEESASASEELSAQAESMKQAVEELVSLVGGSEANTGIGKTGRRLNVKVDHEAAKKAHEALSKGSKMSKTDHVFHSIAKSEDHSDEHSVSVKSDAEKVIPLDDENDFNDFND